MHEDNRKVYCDEGEDFYDVHYNPENGEIEVKVLTNSKVRKEYFETIRTADDNSSLLTLVCARSETHALEKAARILKKHFEQLAEEASNAFYEELNNRVNCWYAKFIPATKTLNLTCIREVPTGYSLNLVFIEEQGGYPKFFTFVEAKEYDSAWEKAFRLFRDYINSCNDTLDHIDSRKK